MPTTDDYALRYPNASAPVLLDQQLQQLAEDIDAALTKPSGVMFKSVTQITTQPHRAEYKHTLNVVGAELSGGVTVSGGQMTIPKAGRWLLALHQRVTQDPDEEIIALVKDAAGTNRLIARKESGASGTATASTSDILNFPAGTVLSLWLVGTGGQQHINGGRGESGLSVQYLGP